EKLSKMLDRNGLTRKDIIERLRKVGSDRTVDQQRHDVIDHGSMMCGDLTGAQLLSPDVEESLQVVQTLQRVGQPTMSEMGRTWGRTQQAAPFGFEELVNRPNPCR